MNVDARLRIVKKYVEQESGIEDISIRTKTNDLVFARWAYFDICRKYISCSQDRCARLVNRDHATYIHAMKNIDTMPPKFKSIVTMFDELLLVDAKEDESEVYDALVKSEAKVRYQKRQISSLNRAIDRLKGNSFTARLIDLMNGMEFEQELAVKARIEAIITMETKKKQYKPVKQKPLV